MKDPRDFTRTGDAATVAAGLAASTKPATPISDDPIIPLYADRERLRAAIDASWRRVDEIAARHGIPDSGLPYVDRSRPGFQSTPWADGHPLQLAELHRFNAAMVLVPCDGTDEALARLAAAKARVEWWEAESARIYQWRDDIGYTGAIAAAEALGDQLFDLEQTIYVTPARTLAGVICKVKIAAQIIRETRANDEDGMNFDDRLILRAVAEFERLGGATP